MAQFRATVFGARGEASRLGHKATGIRTQTNGWTCGIDVQAHHNENGEDVFRVYLTSGSSGDGESFLVGEYTQADLDRLWA